MIESCNHDSQKIICEECELKNTQTLADNATGQCDGVIPLQDSIKINQKEPNDISTGCGISKYGLVHPAQ